MGGQGEILLVAIHPHPHNDVHLDSQKNTKSYGQVKFSQTKLYSIKLSPIQMSMKTQTSSK